MANTVYGYIRVSDKVINESEQLLALQEYGIDDSHIYADNLAGGSCYPLAYQELIKSICPGDSIVVKSIYQLGDNYNDIVCEWEKILKEHGTIVIVLDMVLPESVKALNGLFVSELVLDVLKYSAEATSRFRKDQQKKGISAARQRGVKLGPPSKKNKVEYEKVKEAYKNGEINITQAAAMLNVNRATFRRWMVEENMVKEENIE